MLLPIGDTPQPPRGYVPWVTWLLLAANVLIWLVLTLPLSFTPPDPNDPLLPHLLDRIAQALPPGARFQPSAWDLFVERWGFVPGRPSLATLMAAMFLHANFAHVAGNMLFLWIYGDNVEHRLGRVPFLVTYLASGVAATLGFALVAADPQSPLVGASGAISGVLGCYFLMFPRNKVKLFVGLFPFVMDVWLVPAPLVLGMYVVIDNLLPFVLNAGGSVAYGAHLGGFVAGLALAGAAELVLRARTPEASVRSSDAPESRAAAHLVTAEELAAEGQVAAAYQHYVAALELADDPALVARARRGLAALPLDPRLGARLGL